MSYGRHGAKDADLLNMQLEHGKVLPWLVDLLEEIQFFRDEFGDETQEDHTDRVTYLESVLDKLGADYEKDAKE